MGILCTHQHVIPDKISTPATNGLEIQQGRCTYCSKKIIIMRDVYNKQCTSWKFLEESNQFNPRRYLSENDPLLIQQKC